MKRFLFTSLRYWLAGAAILCAACWSPAQTRNAAWASPHFADYDSELRQADGRVDIDANVIRLKELGVSTYYWLVWHAATDWDDLKLFLPKAAAASIQVWVYLVPPSESPPQYGSHYSEPFRLDYHRWGEEIARLSLQHTNLTAWVIDDFYANHEFFTPPYLRDMQDRAKRINPRLAFLPLMYFGEITRGFVEAYHEVIDGVVVAYPQGADEISYARAVLNGETIAMPGQLGCPWSVPTQPGDFVTAELSARVLPGRDYRLRFREQDDFIGPTEGYHFKQLLVDGAVVWEEDVAGGSISWRDIDLDVSDKARGKTNVTIAFRLMDKKGVSNFGVRWRLQDLRTEGLQPEATLTEPHQWKVSLRGPLEAGFGEALKEPGRRFRIPFIVMTAGHAGEFRQRHGEPASTERIADWLRMCLQTWHDGQCDGVVTYCLDKESSSATFVPAKELFGEFKAKAASRSRRAPATEWRSLPLITNGRIGEGWVHVGWGGFSVDGDSLRTECDPRGLGLLVHKEERFGDCQIRVVFRSQKPKSNAGVFVRIADGILERVGNPGAAFDRNSAGKISPASGKKMQESAERDEGPWFAVHRGYEVQIMDDNDPFHRTGAIYSLAPSSFVSQKPADEWKTMIITLEGNRILVEVDGKSVTTFDSESASLRISEGASVKMDGKSVPARPKGSRERNWFEPKREPKRPEAGYIGLQNHDPGDVVWFREVSIRPLPKPE